MENECVLCGTAIDGLGNNPWPIADLSDGRCCEICVEDKVLVVRMEMQFISETARQLTEKAIAVAKAKVAASRRARAESGVLHLVRREPEGTVQR